MGRSRVQYGYVRFGPIDLSGVTAVKAVLSSPQNNGGATQTAIFVDPGADARAYQVFNEDPGRVTKNYVNGIQNHVSLTLDVSALSGEYYVYAGGDSNGGSWGGERISVIEALTLEYADTPVTLLSFTAPGQVSNDEIAAAIEEVLA